MQLDQGDETGLTDRYGSTTLYSYPFFRERCQKNTVSPDVATVFSYGLPFPLRADQSLRRSSIIILVGGQIELRGTPLR